MFESLGDDTEYSTILFADDCQFNYVAVNGLM